ncbi:hypothetical protein HK102_004120, partial [Quaeritorhiza haematococci]
MGSTAVTIILANYVGSYLGPLPVTINGDIMNHAGFTQFLTAKLKTSQPVRVFLLNAAVDELLRDEHIRNLKNGDVVVAVGDGHRLSAEKAKDIEAWWNQQKLLQSDLTSSTTSESTSDMKGIHFESSCIIPGKKSKAKRDKDDKPRNPDHVKGPAGAPIFGNLFDLPESKLHEYVLEQGLQFINEPEGMFKFVLPHLTLYFPHDPEILRYILGTHTSEFVKDAAYKEIQPLGGDGLFTTLNEGLWKVSRKAWSPFFHTKILKTFMNVFTETTRTMLERWEPYEGVGTNISPWFARVTLDIVGRAGMSYDFRFCENPDAKETRNLFNGIVFILKEIDGRIMLPVLKYLPRPANFRFNREVAAVDSIIYKVITEREKKAAQESNDGDGTVNDLLDIFLNLDFGGLSEKQRIKQLRDEVVTLMIAGHETTANLLNWTLYELAQHPDVLKRARDEIYAVMGEHADDRYDPKWEEIVKCKYIGQIISETLRFHPPVPMVTRCCTQDVVLNGIKYPKGSVFSISPYLMHRHPKYWPKNPNEWDPDRFAFEREQAEARHPFCYMPFLQGPRNCVGMEFALLEAKTILIMILLKYDFELDPDGPEIEGRSSLTLHLVPGLWLK